MRLAQSVPWMCFVGLLTAASPSEAQPRGGASPKGAGQQGAAGQTAIQAPRAPSEAMSDKARKLYMEGVTASEKGRWADAYASFVAAWALQKHYTIAGGIGTCELMLQRYPDAAKHLAIYVREIEKDTTATPDERAAALKTYAQARAKVGAVRLHVNVEDAEVRVGQEVVGTVPLEDPVFLEPGTHTISVRRQGYEPASVAVELKAGEEIERSVELKSARVSEPAAGERPGTAWQGGLGKGGDPPPNKTLLIAGGAVAGVGVIAGTVFTILYFGKADDAENLRQQIRSGAVPERYCPDPGSPPICAELNDTVDVQYVFANAAIGSFILGAAGVGTVIYALVDRPSAPDRRVQVAPLAGSGVAGLSLSGRF
ncbi:PEGA domain-containing protein [Sorangium sp. So ce542]|uniref:PEGA domain-containing protein n=1 Tax=Sorangium sp. So ce542 TaxID=3133316 RepID=UPI003F60F893